MASKPPGDILAALHDPELFAPHFQGDTWEAWKVFLAGLFALPMTPEGAEIFTRHTGRAVAPVEAFNRLLKNPLRCGF